VGFESARLSVAQKEELRRAGGAGIRWVGIENSVEASRAVKDAAEIAQLREAARIGSQVFAEILPLVRPGVRESELAAEIEYRFRRKGASGAAFETIVASGVRSAQPHARATARRLRKNELVVLDLGAILRHYCCDLTRTVYLGRAPSRIRRWYGAVLEAQAAARAALQPGAIAATVDQAARRILRRFGVERYFSHSTGHGLGLEVHEEPRLAKGQTKLIQAGNVVTLEPGVYVPGIGGIRIEDDVAVWGDGTEVLTTALRDFLEL
jgi:Xaa-Pro aminopeptidase